MSPEAEIVSKAIENFESPFKADLIHWRDVWLQAEANKDQKGIRNAKKMLDTYLDKHNAAKAEVA